MSEENIETSDQKKNHELCEQVIEKARECADLLKDRDVRFVGVTEERKKKVKI